MVPFRYPRLDHFPRVMESNDQPATIAAVRVGITRERTPDCLHERYFERVKQTREQAGVRAHIGLNPSEPVHEQNIKEQEDYKPPKT